MYVSTYVCMYVRMYVYIYSKYFGKVAFAQEKNVFARGIIFPFEGGELVSWLSGGGELQ